MEEWLALCEYEKSGRRVQLTERNDSLLFQAGTGAKQNTAKIRNKQPQKYQVANRISNKISIFVLERNTWSARTLSSPSRNRKRNKRKPQGKPPSLQSRKPKRNVTELWCRAVHSPLKGTRRYGSFRSRKTEKQVPIREPDLLIVMTGGTMAYSRPDGVKVIPLACLKD